MILHRHTHKHSLCMIACPSSTPAVFPLRASIYSFQAWERGTCWIWIHTIPLRLTLLLVYSPTQPRKHKHTHTSCRLSECVRDTATLLAFGFVLACFSALYTVCMMVTLQSCGMKVSRAKNVTPLKHGTAGLCWNRSLARSLDVFTATEQQQQNTMLTSHSGTARVNCDRLRSSLDCSIESGKKKCECNSFCVSPARMVVTCLLGSSWMGDKENGFVAAYPTYDNDKLKI